MKVSLVIVTPVKKVSIIAIKLCSVAPEIAKSHILDYMPCKQCRF